MISAEYNILNNGFPSFFSSLQTEISSFRHGLFDIHRTFVFCVHDFVEILLATLKVVQTNIIDALDLTLWLGWILYYLM